MKSQTLYIVLCSVLIMLWAYAGIMKLTAFELFQKQMDMQILPHIIKNILGKLLPFMEIGLAFMLCFNSTRRIGLYISVIFLIGFTLYIGLALTSAFPRRPCSCGGVFEHVGWKLHFIINLCFTALNVISIIIDQRKEDATLQESF